MRRLAAAVLSALLALAAPLTAEDAPFQITVTQEGVATSLPPKEFALLNLLAQNAGRVLPRSVIIERVWGADYFGDTKTLDVHIKRLRSRVEADPAEPTLILTVRGVGYTLEP